MPPAPAGTTPARTARRFAMPGTLIERAVMLAGALLFAGGLAHGIHSGSFDAANTAVGFGGVAITIASAHASATRTQRDAAQRRRDVVLDLPLPAPKGTQPSTLLLPHRRVLAHQGRDLDRLRAWTAAPPSDGRRFFHLSGPSLTGKTRLVDELAHHLQEEGWQVGQLRVGAEAHAWPALCGVPGRQLVVLELGTASPHAAKFLDAATSDVDDGPLVLLVGRPRTLIVPGVCATTRAALEEISSNHRSDDRLELSITGELTDQSRWYGQAAAALRAALTDTADPAVTAPWAPTPAPPWTPTELTPIGALQVHALAWALEQHTPPPHNAHARGLAEVLADSETEQWPPLPFPHPERLPRQCFTAAYLTGATDRDTLLAALAGVHGLEPANRPAAATWLLQLYPDPGTPGEPGSPGFRPPLDLIATPIVIPVIAEDRDMIAELIPDNPLRVAQMAARLISTADLYPDVTTTAAHLLGALGRPMDPATLAAVLAASTTSGAMDRLLANDLARRPPAPSTVTALLSELEERDELLHARIELRRQHVQHLRDVDSEACALSLNELGIDFLRASESTRGRSCFEESMTLISPLLDEAAHLLPHLQFARAHRATALRGEGEVDLAFEEAQAAAEMTPVTDSLTPTERRAVAAAFGELTDLALERGDMVEVLKSGTVVETLLEPHIGDSEADADGYAAAVQAIAFAHVATNQGKSALPYAEAGVRVREALFEKNEIRYGRRYARSLMDLAAAHDSIENREAAIAFAERSVQLGRSLERRSQSSKPSRQLALALNGLAVYYINASRGLDAIECSTESVTRLRLIASNREVVKIDLAGALMNLAVGYLMASERERTQAARHATESLEILDSLNPRDAKKFKKVKAHAARIVDLASTPPASRWQVDPIAEIEDPITIDLPPAQGGRRTVYLCEGGKDYGVNDQVPSPPNVSPQLPTRSAKHPHQVPPETSVRG